MAGVDDRVGEVADPDATGGQVVDQVEGVAHGAAEPVEVSGVKGSECIPVKNRRVDVVTLATAAAGCPGAGSKCCAGGEPVPIPWLTARPRFAT